MTTITTNRIALLLTLTLAVISGCTADLDAGEPEEDRIVAFASVEYWDGSLELDTAFNIYDVEEQREGKVVVTLDEVPPRAEDLIIFCSPFGLASAITCNWNYADGEIDVWLYENITEEWIRTNFSLLVLDGEAS